MSRETLVSVVIGIVLGALLMAGFSSLEAELGSRSEVAWKQRDDMFYDVALVCRAVQHEPCRPPTAASAP